MPTALSQKMQNKMKQSYIFNLETLHYNTCMIHIIKIRSGHVDFTKIVSTIDGVLLPQIPLLWPHGVIRYLSPVSCNLKSLTCAYRPQSIYPALQWPSQTFIVILYQMVLSQIFASQLNCLQYRGYVHPFQIQFFDSCYLTSSILFCL